jgi:hypothetical protein
MDEADHDLAHLRALGPDRTPRASTPLSRTREPSPLPSLHTLQPLQPLRTPRPRTTPTPLPTPTDNAHAHPPCAPALIPLESPPSPPPTPDPLDTPPRPIDPDIIHILHQLRYRRASPSSIQATLARLRTATPAASTAPDRPLCHSTTSPLPRARSPSTRPAARPPPLRKPAHPPSFAALQM